MSQYRIVLMIIVVFFVGMIYLMFANFKDLSVAVPANLKKEEPISPYEGWREFAYKEENFSAKFPAIVQNAKDTVTNPYIDGKLLYDMYASEQWNGAIYMVNVITYPKNVDLATVKQFLTTTLQSHQNSKLISSEEIRFAEHPAIEFVSVAGEAQTNGILLADKDKIYFLTYITEESNRNLKDYDYFKKSFKLLIPRNQSNGSSKSN